MKKTNTPSASFLASPATSRSLAFLPGILLVISSLVLGCGQAKNTPQEALETLRSALKDQKWDLLYEILPDAEQKKWDAIIGEVVASNQEQRANVDQLKKMGFDVAKPGDLLEEIGLSAAQWSALPQRERFAKVFALNSKVNLLTVGVNPELVLSAKVRTETVTGDRAELILDDGKGHRPKLIFKLQGEYWRFQLSGDEK